MREAATLSASAAAPPCALAAVTYVLKVWGAEADAEEALRVARSVPASMGAPAGVS